MDLSSFTHSDPTELPLVPDIPPPSDSPVLPEHTEYVQQEQNAFSVTSSQEESAV